jgi:hypothetical protein
LHIKEGLLILFRHALLEDLTSAGLLFSEIPICPLHPLLCGDLGTQEGSLTRRTSSLASSSSGITPGSDSLCGSIGGPGSFKSTSISTLSDACLSGRLELRPVVIHQLTVGSDASLPAQRGVFFRKKGRLWDRLWGCYRHIGSLD